MSIVRLAAVVVPCLVFAAPAAVAQARPAGAMVCLRESEIREEVAAKRVVRQVIALRAAGAAIGGEAVRARLCRQEDGLVYVITVLRRDGKVKRVTVDAASGKVAGTN
jgi:uncharacterized membrane protein YkoI